MRFAVISDTHFFADGKGKDGAFWNKTLQSRSGEIGEAIVKSVSSKGPDFVIHCGDFTGLCDMENFYAGSKIMNQLPCPWYIVPGNNDTWYPGVRDEISKLYGLPQGQCYYSRLIDDILLVFLDVCYWRAKDGTISPYLDKDLYDSGLIEGLVISQEELAWLENQLKLNTDKSVILVSHAPLGCKSAYPVATMPDGRLAREGGVKPREFISLVTNIAQIRNLLSKFSNVRLSLSGHWHINDIYREDGIVFCQTASMREYPFEFRLFDVKNGILSVTTHSLDNSSFRADSIIKEYKNYWVEGRQEDREFTMDL